ncbi:DUF6734 family protein [Micromonospora chalcea]|uniref:DUF6734 family protein n=1 Tax=Micromonospora sp. TSRI0369 TaxID=1703936 RepID=UPI0009394D55|nr:DUF6734 family protein [Micromonospora sp. TSRI0369]OKJ33975.1 hypothetical protein AMK25_29795 [Micromonospora sp. TSRI0369]
MNSSPVAEVPAFHTLWTAPSRARGVAYEFTPWEVVTAVLSVRSWQRFHGPVRLYTDDAGAHQLDRLGLLDLYADVSTDLDDVTPYDVDPVVYYTGGKLVALAAERAPVAMLDLDLFLLSSVDTTCADFVFAHVERATGDIYPPLERLPGTDRVAGTPPDLAANTALAVFNNERHRAAFTTAARTFMRGNADPAGCAPVALPAFCEQRLVLCEAERLGLSYAPVTPAVWDPRERAWSGDTRRAPFHHTWIRKRLLARDPLRQARYVRRLVTEVARNWPADLDRLTALASLAPAVAEVRSRGPVSGP